MKGQVFTFTRCPYIYWQSYLWMAGIAVVNFSYTLYFDVPLFNLNKNYLYKLYNVDMQNFRCSSKRFHFLANQNSSNSRVSTMCLDGSSERSAMLWVAHSMIQGAPTVAACFVIHEHGYNRLARSENENGEPRPLLGRCCSSTAADSGALSCVACRIRASCTRRWFFKQGWTTGCFWFVWK